MNNILKIRPAAEKQKITSFIKSVLVKQGFKNVVIGMSAGLDSTTSFYLLKEVVPPENIFVAHLFYLNSHFKDIQPILKQARIPKENIYEISIEPLVEAFRDVIPSETKWSRGISFNPMVVVRDPSTRQTKPDLVGMTGKDHPEGKIRLGNIMARIRMIILYDLSKKHNALVCGTENRSENLLGYFTRFGDQASDFEPIQHLYKTQVYALAKFLKVPQNILDKEPTAGLWHGQTDEAEFGFTYKEADQVLHLYFDKKISLEEIKKMGFRNTEKIIGFAIKNSYKHRTPYIL